MLLNIVTDTHIPLLTLTWSRPHVDVSPCADCQDRIATTRTPNPHQTWQMRRPTGTPHVYFRVIRARTDDEADRALPRWRPPTHLGGAMNPTCPCMHSFECLLSYRSLILSICDILNRTAVVRQGARRGIVSHCWESRGSHGALFRL